MKRTEGLQVEARQSVLVANSAIHVLGYVRRKVASRLREIVISICSVLVRLHFENFSCSDVPALEGYQKTWKH